MEKSKQVKAVNLGKQMPMSIEAEQALLGAILINNREMEKVSDFLQGEHFADKTHGKIYQACYKMIESGHVADPITLNDYFSSLGESETIGKDYLLRLATSNISGVNTVGYGNLIYDRAIRRDLVNIGQNIVEEAISDNLEENAKKQIENAEANLYKLALTGSSEGELQNFKTTLNAALENAEEAYKNGGGISGVSSGFRDLDSNLGGLNPSDLLIIAGRPGMGKTTFALNVTFNVAFSVFKNEAPEKLKGPVAFFSLEMSADQLSSKILSMNAEIESKKLRKGGLSKDEFQKLTAVSRGLENVQLYIDDTPGISVTAIRNKARRLKRTSGGLSCIIIDYLQLLTTSGKQKENRVQELSEMTRQLKMLAKELEVPVIVLSQLSRQVESRDDKRPQLSDLRESGSIEQDADIVMFVYREAYYHEQKKPQDDGSVENLREEVKKWETKREKIKNRCQIIIGKNRHGETGTIHLFANMAISKLGDLAQSQIAKMEESD